MTSNGIVTIGLAAIFIATMGSASIPFPSIIQHSYAQESPENSTVVRDSQTILLEGKTIPAKDYIHLYDATPYMVK